ncbi:phosphatase PAP2 family protein [Pseudomonas entomophila]|uniref:phosphatase PAP2 family protein n=1 Tax=Pseudomonas entomophila TaxID=312306 RepID=UPI003EB6C478
MNTPVMFRLWQMLLGWGSVGLVYTLTDHWQGAGRIMQPSSLDRMVAFTPHAIWLYLSFFLVVPLGYCLTPLHRVRWLSRAMRLTALGAGLVYLAWPTTMVYPVDAGATFSSTLLAALIAVDSTNNCLPSLHMALMVLAVWGIGTAGRTRRTLFFLVWVVAIAYSILQLRRHLFIDVVSGAALALAAGWLSQAFDRTRRAVPQEDPQ